MTTSLDALMACAFWHTQEKGAWLAGGGRRLGRICYFGGPEGMVEIEILLDMLILMLEHQQINHVLLTTIYQF